MTPEQTHQRLIKQGRVELRKVTRMNKTKALTYLKAMDPIVFEFLTAALFEQEGYKVKTTVASGDEGVDVLAVKRKGLKKVVIQCKRYSGSVGQPTIRDLYGTMMHNRANAAYLVTTATITRQAHQWAKGKPIHLIDGYELVNWIATSKPKSRLPLWVGAILLLLLTLSGVGVWWFDNSETTPSEMPYKIYLPHVQFERR